MPHHFPEKNKGCEDGLTTALCHQTLVQQVQQFWKVRASVTCNQLLLFCDTSTMRCHIDKVRASSVGAEGGKLVGFLR